MAAGRKSPGARAEALPRWSWYGGSKTSLEMFRDDWFKLAFLGKRCSSWNHLNPNLHDVFSQLHIVAILSLEASQVEAKGSRAPARQRQVSAACPS